MDELPEPQAPKYLEGAPPEVADESPQQIEKSESLAVVLSLVCPGLGHWYIGCARRGLALYALFASLALAGGLLVPQFPHAVAIMADLGVSLDLTPALRRLRDGSSQPDDASTVKRIGIVFVPIAVWQAAQGLAFFGFTR